MVRVRFAPSPTGSLHLGGALVALANRRLADERGGVLVLRLDDTDPARNVTRGEGAILADLEWLGIRWDEGPVRQSERGERYRAAAGRLLAARRAFEEGGAVRFDRERRPTLLRADGSATYHLASVVDDVELGITHVLRGKDHLPNAPLHRELARALGAEPPEYLHVGLLVGPDGRKLSKRDHALASLSDLRAAGFPAEAVRAYLEELGLPQGDVRLDLARLRRLALDAIAAMSDEELAAAVGAPGDLAPALRGARDLREAREYAEMILAPLPPPPVPLPAVETLERFRDLVASANGALDAQALVAELRAGGADLRAVRLALTGRERGPELWTIVRALAPDEALRRVDAGLAAARSSRQQAVEPADCVPPADSDT